MRIVALTLCAAASAVAAVTAAAAPALADQRHSATTTIRISPHALAPGAEVEVWAFGCPNRVATASSPVFVDDAELTPEGDALFSEATIRSTATKGPHRVTVDCADGLLNGRRGGGQEDPGGQVDPGGQKEPGGREDPGGQEQHPGRQVDPGGRAGQDGRSGVSVAVERPPSPVAPVRAGGGGTAPGAGRARDDIDGAEAYGLLLSGGTAVAVGGLAVHRRRRPSGTAG
ncbi:hypothetical protein ACFT8W_28250 [Streptomyces hygroscopicus]|uniref:hypothetical protein n=1 Tax=Streptomyces hygroscopicus TaxID=1912 RepID=UPI003633F326